MRILITGAGGYLGSNLLAELAAGKDVSEIIAVDDFSTNRYGTYGHMPRWLPKERLAKVRLCRGSYSDICVMARLLDAVDTVVHLGERKKRDGSGGDLRFDGASVGGWAQNVEGTRSLLELCVICGVKRFVFGSWTGVHVPLPQFEFITEDMPLVPVDQYFYQKIAGEYYVRHFGTEYSLDTAILRLSNVYGKGRNPLFIGPYDKLGVVARFIRDVRAGKGIVIHGSGAQKRNFLHVSDAVDALARAVRHPGALKGGVFNICGDRDVPINELAGGILAAARSKGLSYRAKLEYRKNPAKEGIVQFRVSNRKAARVLGFSPKRDLFKTARELLADKP